MSDAKLPVDYDFKNNRRAALLRKKYRIEGGNGLLASEERELDDLQAWVTEATKHLAPDSSHLDDLVERVKAAADPAAKAAERIRTEDYKSIEPIIRSAYAPAMAVVDAAVEMDDADMAWIWLMQEPSESGSLEMNERLDAAQATSERTLGLLLNAVRRYRKSLDAAGGS